MNKFRITLQPEGESFDVSPGEVILDAAISQHVNVSYSCRSGTCRTCLYQVVSGRIDPLEPEQCLITPQELNGGRRLLCMAQAASDAILEPVSKRRVPKVTG